jgi:hypothetical protein
MTERGFIGTQDQSNADSPLEEAYRRLAKLHYALAVADSVTESLHHRAIDDLMDVLEILEPSMPPRSMPPSGNSPEK